MICLISETNNIGSHLGYCKERPISIPYFVIRCRYCELSNLRGGILHFEKLSVLLRQLSPTWI